MHMVQPAILHLLAVHARRGAGRDYAGPGVLTALEVDVFEVEGVYVTGEVAKDGESDIDEEVGAAACDEEDAEGWDEERDKNETDFLEGAHFVGFGYFDVS